MPAMGELGYIVVRMYAIDQTISKLWLAYSVGVQFMGDGFWASSEHSSSYASRVYTDRGFVYGNFKGEYNYVRAFMRL